MMNSSFETSPALSAPTSTEQTTDSYLFCTLSEKLYAMQALAVREVLPLPEVTSLHENATHLSGFVYLRGQFVPVVNLSECLNLPPLVSDMANALVVLEHNGNLAGIVVNEVKDVRPIARSDITTVASASGEVGDSCIEGIARTDDETVQLLNLDWIFALTTGYSTGAFLDYKATQYEAEDAETKRGQTIQAAVVEIYGELFSIEVNWIREFAPLRTITPVPSCPDSVVGLMNLRGEILTIIDISASLRLVAPAEKREENQVVIVECDDWKVGILVDEVLDIFGLPTHDFNQSAVPDNNEPLRGTTWFREKIMGVLDVPRLLQQERRMLEERF